LTEVINGAGFRDDSLVTLFVLMSVIFHIKGRVSLSVASYAISLFSKEAALTVPLLLIFYDLSGHNKTPMLRYSGYALVTAIYLALRFYFLYNPAEATFTTPLSLEDKLVSIPMAILYYLRVILFPTSLSADYAPYSFMTSPTFCSLAFANILFLGTLTLFANKNYHGTVSIFGLFWFFVTLLPVLNLIAIANPFSERYLYLPSVGLIFFLTSLLYEKVTNTKAIVYLAIPVVIFFVVLSIYRNSLWENEETLWSDAMTKAPLSTRSYINLARVSNMNNDYDGAISYLEKALSLNPNSCIAYNSMGVAYLNKGELEDALKRTLQAVKLCPSYTSAYLNLGLIYERLGKIEDAKDSYLKSIEVEPDNPAAHFYLGIIIGSEGRTEQAIKEFMTTLDEDPDFPEAHYNLGWAYELKKDYSSALKEYIAELNINESYHSARFGLIRIYINTGLFEAAELETKRLLEDSQNNAEAQRYLEYVGSIKNKKQGHDRDL
jgi:tetratricopeptide (TPR) repeat protein